MALNDVVTFDDLFDAVFKFAQGIGRIFTVCGQVAEVHIVFKLHLGDPADLGMILYSDKTYGAKMLFTELVNA
jgi:hypothetical protein